MKLILLRTHYTETTTSGVLLLNEKFFAYTLEDALRPPGIKVYGKTCIPSGYYNVVITRSNRFKKNLPLIKNVPGFDGIRIHGGNTHKNTLGCPLIAGNRLSWTRIWKSKSKALTDILTRSPDGFHAIEIINTRN